MRVSSASLLFIFISLLPCKTLAAIESPQDTVAVDANAELSLRPDFATIQLGVETLEKGAASSTSKNAQVVAQMEKVLRERFKVAADDIRTREYRVNAEYSYTANKREFLGFRTVNVLSITVRQIDKLGLILDALSSAGMNSVQGIEFDSTIRDEIHFEALQKATELARKKAEVIAKASGRSIKRLLKAESGQKWSHSGPTPMHAMKMAAETAEPTTFIAPGTLKLNAEMRALYLLQ